jgi:hypothetical protein
MRPVLTVVVLGLIAGIAAATIAVAAGPSFTVRCMHTSGPTTLPKYGTYYFFLPESQVKGYACSNPGRPCQIVSRDAAAIVFQTPGQAPDTIKIDLSNGAIQHKTVTGLESTFACRQVPNNS